MITQRTLLFLGFLAVPALTSAAFTDPTPHYYDSTARYSDAPFTKPEAAGISVLTNIGAVEGNPDGSFGAKRTLNRAEFVKIVLESNMEHSLAGVDTASCFPDVKTGDWFQGYVCAAKSQGLIKGYPDGFFRPEKSVNYAEALKILGTLYHLDDATNLPATHEWYLPYLNGAADKGIELPGLGDHADHFLTRGEMARLAGGYVAFAENSLDLYRAFKIGNTAPFSSSSSLSSASSLSSSVSSVSLSSPPSSASSSSQSAQAMTSFPAISHFFLIGQRTPAAIDGTFTSPDEDGVIRSADVTLRQEVKSIGNMTLMDQAGKEIGTLVLTTDNNSDHRKWRMTLPDTASYKLIRGVPAMFGVAYNLRTRDNGGVNSEFIDGIESFFMTTVGVATNTSKQILPTNPHYPQHQTADGKVTAILNAGSGTSTVHAGTNRLLGRFAIKGDTATGGVLKLSSMRFILGTTNVMITNIRIGGTSAVQQSDCGVDASEAGKVTCPIIPTDFQEVAKSGQIISLIGDIALQPGVTSGSMQVTFSGRGKIGQTGALTWKDSTGTYNWIEPSTALENGTMWTVTP